jgi:hypothetical protein
MPISITKWQEKFYTVKLAGPMLNQEGMMFPITVSGVEVE